MFDTASGWLITSLDANPMIVSLVQVAVSLPLFLFTLPSGALADVIDSRRLLIAVELAILAISVIFAWPGFAEPRDPGAPAGDDLHVGRGRRAHLARLGGQDSSSRTQGGA